MEQQINPQEIMEKLARLQAQVDRLQEDFEDTQLTEDDIESLRLAEEEYKEGKTISIEDLKREVEEDASN